jgi:hypothetical protein
MAMTRRQKERLYKLVLNPPKGSKLEAAKKYGVDLTLNLRLLALTPNERVKEHDRALRLALDLRAAGERARLRAAQKKHPEKRIQKKNKDK